MDCRPNCGACCIAPSISSAIPGIREGQPQGKPAGAPCVQLDADYRCKIFGQPNRPQCCGGLQPSAEMCGADRNEALAILQELEHLTAPKSQPGKSEAFVGS